MPHARPLSCEMPAIHASARHDTPRNHRCQASVDQAFKGRLAALAALSYAADDPNVSKALSMTALPRPSRPNPSTRISLLSKPSAYSARPAPHIRRWGERRYLRLTSLTALLSL